MAILFARTGWLLHSLVTTDGPKCCRLQRNCAGIAIALNHSLEIDLPAHLCQFTRTNLATTNIQGLDDGRVDRCWRRYINRYLGKCPNKTTSISDKQKDDPFSLVWKRTVPQRTTRQWWQWTRDSWANRHRRQRERYLSRCLTNMPPRKNKNEWI